MGKVLVIVVFLAIYGFGLWGSIAAFHFKKSLGYLTAFLIPFLIGFLFGSVSVFYLIPVLLVSLGVYHLVKRPSPA
ncbi:hypothetical protein [Halobacillus salinus]|uniref:Uncharacterized protein n=1 Tax=Halobacillus salinus TaxID=192814 RepID=A0A4Z0H0R4_9BACI|nr:hypothetical protein [Halobacillus salinus]TGB03700.1 hypothetical protein E4663_01470 [Halobacillus salinus]